MYIRQVKVQESDFLPLGSQLPGARYARVPLKSSAVLSAKQVQPDESDEFSER